MHWQEIKQQLCEPLRQSTNPNEKKLLSDLSAPITQPVNCPAVALLNEQFIEFLKNSLDARTNQYLVKNNHSIDSVTMTIRIPKPIKENATQIIITDNGPGFEPEYLQKFAQFKEKLESKIKEKPVSMQAAETHQSNKKGEGNQPFKQYYFGGEGKGMHDFCQKLFTKGASMQIENFMEDGNIRGACIILTSPLETQTLVKGKYDDDELPEADISEASGRKSAPPPLSGLSKQSAKSSGLSLNSMESNASSGTVSQNSMFRPLSTISGGLAARRAKKNASAAPSINTSEEEKPSSHKGLSASPDDDIENKFNPNK